MISFSRNKVKGARASPGRKNEDSPSNTRFATALANLFLAISSGWALRKLSGFQFNVHLPYEEFITWSTVPFYLALLHAIVCFATFGNPKYGESIRWLHVWTASLCVGVALPCFALQLAFQHSVPLQSFLPIGAGAGIAGLVYQILQGDLHHLSSILMNSLVMACLTTIGLVSYVHYNYYGISAVLAYSINYFIIGMTGTAFNLPAIDLFTYGYIFFNYFAVKAILD